MVLVPRSPSEPHHAVTSDTEGTVLSDSWFWAESEIGMNLNLLLQVPTRKEPLASLSELSSGSLPSLLSSPRALPEPLRPPQGSLPGQGHLPRTERRQDARRELLTD